MKNKTKDQKKKKKICVLEETHRQKLGEISIYLGFERW